MRHRRKGRVLGRSPSHRLALFRNLSSALILTERDAEHDDNQPEVKGRIITTLEKAKEVRGYLEALHHHRRARAGRRRRCPALRHHRRAQHGHMARVAQER